MNTLIALDIDGTLTSDLHSIPQEIESYLGLLAGKEVMIALVTGRCFSLAYPLLKSWTFPYLLAIHNGAIILRMPEKKIIFKQYIDPKVVETLDEIVSGEETDFALYTGIENEDICYFRPKQFSPRLRSYVRKRAELCKENWVAVDHFDSLQLNSLTAIKCFGSKESAQRIKGKIEKQLSLHVPVIKDPVDQSVYIAQATHPNIDKGTALGSILNGEKYLIIAAGDDHNDLPMLKKADVKIVMDSAPSELKQMADIIAKPAQELGIIEALENARNYWI
ncbi:HAD superfamily hydrolase/phosphatase [Waddlia chondrophila 2032/99]|uniref:HAD superfamily hydrolase/phosphatase n=1 Tax=Waddlia chondrophila 2032/99 TaxID=765953 RepID=F8LED9_9BACT|nr:HAD superfamily hydrolase/phosphatase [Waddlia chondrophila 2032/99]